MKYPPEDSAWRSKSGDREAGVIHISDSVIFSDLLHFKLKYYFLLFIPTTHYGVSGGRSKFQDICATHRKKYNTSVRFGAHIYGVNFIIGVVTGIPMEFLSGRTREGLIRARRRCNRRHSDNEGLSAFILLGSALPALLLYGENRISPEAHRNNSGGCFHRRFARRFIYGASRDNG